MTNWYSPKSFREKIKQTPHPSNQFPREISKKREHSKGLVLGLATLAACFYQSQPSSELVHWEMDFFFGKKPLASWFLLIQKKSYRTNNWSYQPSSQDGFVAPDPTIFFFQTQSAEAGGSKLSGVARGKDRSCGAKVSSRAWKHFGASEPKRPEREKGKGSNWKWFGFLCTFPGFTIFSVSYVGFLESVAFCWKRWACSWWESNFKLKINHLNLKIQTVWCAFCWCFFNSKGLGWIILTLYQVWNYNISVNLQSSLKFIFATGFCWYCIL